MTSTNRFKLQVGCKINVFGDLRGARLRLNGGGGTKVRYKKNSINYQVRVAIPIRTRFLFTL